MTLSISFQEFEYQRKQLLDNIVEQEKDLKNEEKDTPLSFSSFRSDVVFKRGRNCC